MGKAQGMSRYERAHIEHFVQTADEERAQPFTEADVERILKEMHDDDAVIRAKAVRQICPCRVPWDVFQRLRKQAKSLQHDPSPLVAANARHIEVDAKRVAGFESKLEQIQDYEEDADPASRQDGRKRRKRCGSEHKSLTL